MQHITTELRDLVRTCREQFLAYDAAQLTFKPAPNKWSKKELIGHLCDSAQNNLQRFVRGQYYVEPPHIVYHQDEWVPLQHYQDYEISDLVNLWAILNLHLCWVLDHIAPENYNKLVDTGKYGVELHDLQFLATDYVAHLKHHLAQITD
jgi:hypothetical protein